jgi:hypothetical protein
MTGTQLMPSNCPPTAENRQHRGTLSVGEKNNSLTAVDPQLTLLSLHCTPPRMSTGVQPVPMGMFRPLTTTPRRPAIALCVFESKVLEFLTFWQHCCEGVGEPPEPQVGAAETAPTRASAVMKVLENIVVVEVVRVVGVESVGRWCVSEERVDERPEHLYPSNACVRHIVLDASIQIRVEL